MLLEVSVGCYIFAGCEEKRFKVRQRSGGHRAATPAAGGKFILTALYAFRDFCLRYSLFGGRSTVRSILCGVLRSA